MPKNRHWEAAEGPSCYETLFLQHVIIVRSGYEEGNKLYTYLHRYQKFIKFIYNSLFNFEYQWNDEYAVPKLKSIEFGYILI